MDDQIAQKSQSWQASLRLLLSDEHTIMVLLGIIVGVVGGYGAVGFRHLINFIQSIAYGSPAELLEAVRSVPWHMRIAVPAIGGLIVGPIVYFFAREAKGHGVPEVMYAVALKQGIIRKRIVFIKALVSAVCIGTGGSVGREGPIVQIGSAVGSTLGQLFNVSANRMRTMVGCGAAAGIAATFNAPIAGSIFALEIILGEFEITSFSPIIISAVSATAISRHYLGNVPAFILPQYVLHSPLEFPLYAVLGILCALVAVGFTLFLYRTEDAWDSIKFPEYFKAVLGGLIMGTMGLVFPQILGVGYGAIDLALTVKLSWWFMGLLVLCKILATSITIGSGGSGGIFAPSLFLGAMAGGAFGTIAHYFFPSVAASAGAYAVVGMGAVVAATTHGPLQAILIIFEMTSDYKIILPLMITCIISCIVARKLCGESIYTFKLIRRGINIRGGKEVNILNSIPVKNVMYHTVEMIPETFLLKDLAKKLPQSRSNNFVVVDENEKITGVLTFLDYYNNLFNGKLDKQMTVKDIMTKDVVTVSIEDHLGTAMEKITAGDYSILPVVKADDPQKMAGILTRRDILEAYDQAVIKKSIV
ncbi:MAG: chloride channel protein [Deltaproteobacteria bacterium]|jgi:CIC family chloride channel protein|nr:chloride channel protein [Deltaproteobacteria bacterium]